MTKEEDDKGSRLVDGGGPRAPIMHVGGGCGARRSDGGGCGCGSK